MKKSDKLKDRYGAPLLKYMQYWPTWALVAFLGIALVVDTAIPFDLPLLVDDLLIGIPSFVALHELYRRFTNRSKQ